MHISTTYQVNESELFNLRKVYQLFWMMAKLEWIKQVKSYPFLIAMAATLLIAFGSVPSEDASYVTVDFQGTRGEYNSAWIGGMMSILTNMCVWVFGFYLLRAKISEDRQLRVGSFLVSSPMRNSTYLISKWMSNFLFLSWIGMVMMIAFIGMQWMRGYTLSIQLEDYFLPYLLILLPSFCLLASFTILFDSWKPLQGVVGNGIYFLIFIVVMSLSMNQEGWTDLWGSGMVKSQMSESVKSHFPDLREVESMGSFGLVFQEAGFTLKTFVWSGIHWTGELMLYRSTPIILAIFFMMVAIILFRRNSLLEQNSHHDPENKQGSSIWSESVDLMTNQVESIPFLTDSNRKIEEKSQWLVWWEMKILVKGTPIWWYLTILGVNLAALIVPYEVAHMLIAVCWILPIAIWSKIGTKESIHRTEDLIYSSGPTIRNSLSSWSAGILIGVGTCIGPLARMILEIDFPSILAWGMGALFIPSLAMLLGQLSKTPKLFEVFFMIIWYLGPANRVYDLDFMGVINTSFSRSILIFTIAIVCLGISIIVNQLRVRT